jgi:hypothetical protein
VAIEDILKYARKSKERGMESDEVTINELRAQIVDHERTLKSLLQHIGTVESSNSERQALLHPSSTSSKEYGSSVAAFELPVIFITSPPLFLLFWQRSLSN